jgi:hypothetical protein
MANMHDAPSDYDEFQNKGYPGKMIKSETIVSGNIFFTGSRYGASSVIVKTHGGAVFHLADDVGAGAPLAGISASNLTAGVVYDFSLREIRHASSAVIYVLRKHG